MKTNVKTDFKRGYTLLEIAVSLTIIGILVAIAAASVIPMSTVRKLNEFKLASDRAMEWVDRYAMENRRLPNPDTFQAWADNNTGDLILEYHVNSNIASFNLPEMYLGYKINHSEPSNLVPIKIDDDNSTKEDYAYYIDARFPGEKASTGAYRQVKRYYPFLKLMGNGVQNNYVRIITSTLPKGRRLQPYTADILIGGGVTAKNANPSDCNLGRKLQIAVGIRAPAEWHPFFSSKYHGTWDTIKYVAEIFPPEVFLMGTDCTGGQSNTGTVCDPKTLKPVVNIPDSAWVELTNCGVSPAVNPTDYTYTIKSVATNPNAVYKSDNTSAAAFMKGKIPPYLRDFNMRYTYIDTDYPLNKFNYIYIGSHFYFEIFVRDKNNNNVITQKSLRVNLDPVRGVYPPR
ncbi:MAG: type II secretion system GspH family protein [Deferribacteraceae bacterium]|jgi:prepilin-type N-terminal cleavage/methylation domain-containing protein|nr:type II secretion system GspH family protein [Deferribacteraceae bacterium]